MAIGDLYRVAFQMRVHGQTCVNVYYMKQQASPNGDSAAACAQHVTPILGAIYRNYIAGGGFDRNFGTQVTKVDRIFSDQGESAVFDNNTYINQQALPTVNAVVMSLYTGLAGPTRRGRVFLPNIPENFQRNSALNELGQPALSAFVAAFTDAFMGDDATSGYAVGVFSRKRYAIVSNPFDDYWKPVTSAIVKYPIATMRSRKLGVGS